MSELIQNVLTAMRGLDDALAAFNSNGTSEIVADAKPVLVNVLGEIAHKRLGMIGGAMAMTPAEAAQRLGVQL